MRVLLTFIFALALSQAALANPYQVQVSTDPAVIPVGPARLIIRVSANGQPVANATVTAIAEMPGMKMGERVETATASTPPGTYVAPAAFPMEGAYRATVTVRGPQGEGTTVVSMRTGQNTAPGSGIGFMPFVAVGMLGLVGFAIWRSYRLGMRPDWRRLLTPQSLGAVALIVVILGGAIYAVNHWRRPGSMTPIE
ncbi:MAG: FixH family protein, partial [Armatimonadetes bacterium]|nr:FixH family protein [Armatimonadota bacterium]